VFRLPVGQGVGGYVAKHRKGLNITDAYNDPRFNPEFDKMTGYKTKSILCLPIFGPMLDADGNQELLGVSSLINKKVRAENGTDIRIDEFTEEEAEIFRNLLQLVGIAIKSCNLYEDSKAAELEAANLALENIELYQQAKTEMKKGESLLKMAGILYKEENLDILTSTIVSTAKEFMLADKASLFIIDDEKKEVIFFVNQSFSQLCLTIPPAQKCVSP
jgi:dual 3',5'-cyclic-AMP and -GMP phosphodiesterase 11